MYKYILCACMLSQLLSIHYISVRSIHRVRSPRHDILGDEVGMAASATFRRIEEFDGDKEERQQ